jgi:5-methyltetrahydrofolate--homocysteine methyltransferase
MSTLIEAIVDMREEDAIRNAREMLDTGTSPQQVLDDCRAAMAEVGKRHEAGEYFVPELILAGEMLRQISEVVKPKLAETAETA